MNKADYKQKQLREVECPSGFVFTLRKPNQLRLLNSKDRQPRSAAIEAKLQAEGASPEAIHQAVAEMDFKDQQRLAIDWLIDCAVSPRVTATEEEAEGKDDALWYMEIDQDDFIHLCDVIAQWAGLLTEGDLALAGRFPKPDDGGADAAPDGNPPGQAG